MVRVLSIAKRRIRRSPGGTGWSVGRPAAMPPQAVSGRSRLRPVRPDDFPDSTPDGRLWPSKEECTLAKATAITTKLRPLGDRVVIQPSAREEMTKSGIVLPDTAKEKPQEGTILAAGPGRILEDGKREAMDVKTGDKVLYAKYAGTEFKVEGEELLIVSQKDILAIVAN
jgi:chaperonin GroES